jgi:hypothetical protein
MWEMKEVKKFLSGISQYVRNHDLDDVLDLLPMFDQLNVANWRSLINYEDGAPVTTILYQTNLVKLVLIYWQGRQSSPVHGHPGGGGLIRLLSGELVEKRFDPEDPERVIDKHRFRQGALSYIHDMFAWHQVENPADRPAVSLHLYSLESRRAE